jgi:glutamate racemase
MKDLAPIGVFDSGYGGLTVLKEITARLPQYDYIYLGDNARAPYGNRSFETVYQYTLECVKWLFKKGCSLVILACNTASAKALRTIQQKDLPLLAPEKRVLGVIRPTAEIIGKYSSKGSIGVLATGGTVASGSYPMEIAKFFPGLRVYQQACPLWAPLVENNEQVGDGADYFIKKDLAALFAKSPHIDALLLGCTHYPLLIEKIKKFIPPGVKIIAQGEVVAESLADYLARHPEIEKVCRRNGQRTFFTTDSAADFNAHAQAFYESAVNVQHTEL